MKKRNRKRTMATVENALTALNFRRQGMTLEQIGAEIGVTRERARQLLKLVPQKERAEAEAANAAIRFTTEIHVPLFKDKVDKWLFGAGYIRCNPCFSAGRDFVLPICSFAPGIRSGERKVRVCTDCGTTYHNAYVKSLTPTSSPVSH